MGRRYHGMASAATGTNLTILTLISAATIRPKLYDLIIGCVATPADQATKFSVLRFTAAGTEGSGFTPVAIDPNDPAALADYGCGAFGVEPTYTANSNVLQISMNQRATIRWVAAPGGELMAPATAANGLGVRSISGTGTAAHEVSAWHEE
jgi:hypothetical protein